MLAVSVPWLAAELGLFLPESVFIMERAGLEADGAVLAAVHLGHRHGLDGALLVVTALLLSRPPLPPGRIAAARLLYVSLAFGYGLVDLVQDAWNEQLVKRDVVDLKIPSALEPRPEPIWLDVLALVPRPRRRLVTSRSGSDTLERMEADEQLLARTAELATAYLASLDERAIRPEQGYAELLASLDAAVPEHGLDPLAVVDELAAVAEPGLTAMSAGRFFGFVIGGTLPAALAADWLVSTWDQNTGLAEPTPATSALEQVAGRWVLELLGLPPRSSFAFVTGCQMAHVTCLAAARQAVYERAGWDLSERGLAGAPPLRVIVGGKRHVTLTRALRLLGVGRAQEVVLPVDREGRMRVEELGAALQGDGPTIVCAQAGEVSTGAFDDLDAAADAAREAGAWLHVDGAFGLWAAASPRLAHLCAGHDRADSWATDGHKWLNVPYDCGIAICAHPAAHAAAMEYAAPYLAVSEREVARDPMGYSPEFSRRARSVPVWAAIRSLGRDGVAELVDRCCAHAASFAEQIDRLPGCELVNDVVLNQVLFRFDDETTPAVLAAVQASGEAWMSGTTWDGRPAIRLSVSGWRTTEADIERTVAAFAGALADARVG